MPLCPLLAQSGHVVDVRRCLLLEVKQTLIDHCEMSASDPERTFPSTVLPHTGEPYKLTFPGLKRYSMGYPELLAKNT